MKAREDALVEVLTEELPALSITQLANAFAEKLREGLNKAAYEFNDIHYFATPRRLAVFIQGLSSQQPEQTVLRKGPALKAAFDEKGKPTPACVGFAKSLQIEPSALKTISNGQGEWVAYEQIIPGQAVQKFLPPLIEASLNELPMKRRMRWGSGELSFARPIHNILLMFGEDIISADILGFKTNRTTRGHRFLAPGWMTIPDAATYESFLQSGGFVIANIEKRKAKIKTLAEEALKNRTDAKHNVGFSEDLLNEVTGLVEWPLALCGKFDESFLALPEEVLISAMQDHQRYFPVHLKNPQSSSGDHGQLTPYFIIISNSDSALPQKIITGNERVLRARLKDAAFFYAEDKKESLKARIERLKGMMFQAQLGTLYDKALRLARLLKYLTPPLKLKAEEAEEAAMLAKCDLTTSMVNEFPELEGIMGGYYARDEGKSAPVYQAIREQYLPKISGGDLPQTLLGQALSLADKIDTLVGYFGINQIPSGEKDPYALKRAGMGSLRILIEKALPIKVEDLLQAAYAGYGSTLKNPQTIQQLLDFLYDRLRAWYLDQGISADIFAAVSALSVDNFYDFHQRLLAVKAFKQMPEANSLSIANKRVSNILEKSAGVRKSGVIDEVLFESPEEKQLALQLETQDKILTELAKKHDYQQMLLKLSELREPIDNFFDHVMVNTSDQKRRDNRLLLLQKLRSLFLQVADIAMLQ